MAAVTGNPSNPKPKLEDQAATAALYVTRPEKGGPPSSIYPLDKDKKLSSAGAASSLKYASPRDLPSYPSAGLQNMESSAGAAASLANANQKSFEYWKPDPSSSANKAAMLAKDYKPAPLWHPELSAAGSKAALLAAKDGGNVNIWKPEATLEGNSAAGQAMRNKGLSPQLDYGGTAEGSRRAILAATGAMSGSRRRSGSSPNAVSSYPDSANFAANALNAATVANRSSIRGDRSKSGASNASNTATIAASKIHDAALTNMPREMYTSNPPVAPEVEERNKQAVLRAAAVSMAKQMYDIQQRTIEQAAEVDKSDSHYAANSVHNRQHSVTSVDTGYQPLPQYANLQEAAQRLAAERLAKLHDEHAAYRNYYGTNTPPQSRLSVRGRPRRRASSDGQPVKSDEQRSDQIRSEMSMFNDKLAQVDAKKRQSDRDALMAAAQKNVRASMHGMDERVFAETGKVSPNMMQEWEAKANIRAEADSRARMANHGRVHIGGGKYLDQSEIDAIAATRVQPTLDEISEKAEAKRARDEQLRLEEEDRKRIATDKVNDERQRGIKTKDEWRRFKDGEKREARVRKEEDKTRKVEEKRLRDEERRKTKGTTAPFNEEWATNSQAPALDPIPKLEPISTEGGGPLVVEDDTHFFSKNSGHAEALAPMNAEMIAERVFSSPIDDLSSETPVLNPIMHTETTASIFEGYSTPTAVTEETPTARNAEPVAEIVTHPATQQSTLEGSQRSPTSPKGDSKVSTWLKNKFSRRPNKSTKSDPKETLEDDSKAFTGGAARTGVNTSTGSLDRRDSSVREVAMAGRKGSGAEETKPDDEDLYASSVNAEQGKGRQQQSISPSVSSLSSDEDVRGRSSLRREETASSHVEEFEEAKDHFDSEMLAPPSTLNTVGRASDSPVRDSRFQEDL